MREQIASQCDNKYAHMRATAIALDSGWINHERYCSTNHNIVSIHLSVVSHNGTTDHYGVCVRIYSIFRFTCVCVCVRLDTSYNLKHVNHEI